MRKKNIRFQFSSLYYSHLTSILSQNTGEQLGGLKGGWGGNDCRISLWLPTWVTYDETWVLWRDGDAFAESDASRRCACAQVRVESSRKSLRDHSYVYVPPTTPPPSRSAALQKSEANLIALSFCLLISNENCVFVVSLYVHEYVLNS